MNAPQRGEVWLVDLGMAANVRPAAVISVPASDADRALVTLVPHTTGPRNSRFEVAISVSFLVALAATQSWVGLNPGTGVAIGDSIDRRRVRIVRGRLGDHRERRSDRVMDGEVGDETPTAERPYGVRRRERRHDATDARRAR